MPQGHDFIFFIQDNRRRFWGLDENGFVVCTNNPYPLKYSPDGWQDITVKNVRSRKYWGIDRTVSLPFKFVEDGAKILKYILYTRGPEEVAELSICEQRLAYTAGVSYGYWYKEIFRSEIDLYTFLHEGPTVTANLLENGLAKHLKANEGTVYEFDLLDYVKADGIDLVAAISFLGIEQLQVTNTPTYGYSLLWPSFVYTATEGTSPNVAALSQTSEIWQSNTADDDNRFLTNHFMEAADDAVVTLRGSITARIDSAANGKLYVKSSTGTRTTLFDFTPTAWGSPVPFNETRTFDIDQDFTLVPGEKLYLISSLADTLAVADQGAMTFSEFTLRAETTSRKDATYVPVASAQYLFAEFIDRMTAGAYSAETCPYFTKWAGIRFTSGDAIRGIEGAKLKLSWNQFFEFWDAFDSVGIREKNGAVLFDRKAALTDNTNTIDLGEVTSRPKVKIDKGFYFNELNIGYPDAKSEQGQLNGKNEVNTTAVFSFGTTRAAAKLSKVSKIKASCYDFETTRIEGANKNTTSRTSDTDPYAVHTLTTQVAASGDIPAHYEFDRTYNANVTGVDQIDSVFNLALSPKNMLLNNADYFKSCLYGFDGKTLKFISIDRNRAMVWDDGTTQIIEDADVPMSDLTGAFFTPITLEVEVSSDDDLLDNQDSNPIASYVFQFEGVEYKGIATETSVNPKANKKQTITLLSHPDNDLTRLINYYG